MYLDKSVKPQFLTLIPMLINSVVASCIVNWASIAIYFMNQPDHVPSATVEECSWMESMYQIGRLVFAVPAALLSDKFGRKPLTIVICCLHVLTCAVLSFSDSVLLIFITRFIQGLATSLLTSTCFALIGEVSSPGFRGVFAGFYRIAMTSGGLIQSLSSVYFESYSISMLVTLALTLPVFPSLYWLIETPYHLIAVNKYEEAKRNLRIIRVGKPEVKIDKEFEEMRESIEKDTVEKSNTSWWQYVLLKSNRRPLICVFLLHIFNSQSGQSAIQMYSTIILPENEYISQSSYPLVLTLIQLFASVVATVTLDAFPRRFLYMLASFLSFLVHSMNALSIYMYERGELGSREEEIWKWTFLLGNASYFVISFGVLWPLNAAIRSEIFNHGFKAMANSLISINQAVSAIFLYVSFTALKNHFGLAINYGVFAMCSLITVLVVYLTLPESRGKTLAEIQDWYERRPGKDKKHVELQLSKKIEKY